MPVNETIDQQVAKIQIPEGVKYDGALYGGFAQFTEYDATRPSLGASFYLVDGEITTENLVARRAEVATKFAQF